MRPKRAQWAPKTSCLRPPGRKGAATMRYTTTDGPKKPLNAIQEGSLGGKMGIAALTPPSRAESIVLDRNYFLSNCASTVKITFYFNKSICCAGNPPAGWWQGIDESGPHEPGRN